MARNGGFAYLFLLFSIALIAILLLVGGTLERLARIRSDEAELLRIGGEFRGALASYRNAAEPRSYPASLEDLLSDRRTGVLRRHLRKIYADPITRRAQWGLVLENGRIVGVHSLSEREPLKLSGFDPLDSDFERAERYSDWIFSPVRGAVADEPKPIEGL